MIKKTVEPTGDVCVKFTEDELAQLNIKQGDKFSIKETADGMIIEGRNRKPFEVSYLTEIDSHGDHRLAMSSAIAALYSTQPIEIQKTEFVQTSFPNFFDLLYKLYHSDEN